MAIRTMNPINFRDEPHEDAGENRS
jgi:hypothetical protein